MKNIYERALQAMDKEQIDHHDTDLYLMVTTTSTELLQEYDFKGNVTTFVSAIPPYLLWYDIPFAYTPGWEKENRWPYNSPLPTALREKTKKENNAMNTTITKLYAIETPAEHKESPLDNMGCDSIDGIIIAGNKEYNSIKTYEYDYIISALHNDCNCIVDDMEECKTQQDEQDIIRYYFPGYSITHDQFIILHDALINEDGKTKTEHDTICTFLSVLTNKTYNYRQISGSVQREWNYIYYPEEYDLETIKQIEIEYWNTGTEWSIIITNDEYTDPEEINTDNTEYCYTHGYSNETNITELSNIYGIEKENIILFTIDGYITKAKYTTVKGEN